MNEKKNEDTHAHNPKYFSSKKKIVDRTNRENLMTFVLKCLLCLLISVMDTKSKIQMFKAKVQRE